MPRRSEWKPEAEASRHEDRDMITVSIYPELLECGVCFGPLTPPLFQCTKGHISCSACCTDVAMNGECSPWSVSLTACPCHARSSSTAAPR